MPSAEPWKEICKKRALDSAEAFDGPTKAIKLNSLGEYEHGPCMESHVADYSNSSVPLPVNLENNGYHNPFVNETAAVKTETSCDEQESSPLRPKALLELPVMPLIWAQVCVVFLSSIPYSMLYSRDKKYAKVLTGSGATKEVFTSPTMSPEVIC